MKTCLLWKCCISKSYIQRPQVPSLWCYERGGGVNYSCHMQTYLLWTFEVGPDAGVVSRCPPHELVQEVWRRHLWPGPVGGLYLLLTGAQSDTSQATAESMNREIKENFPGTVKKELEYRLQEKAVGQGVSAYKHNNNNAEMRSWVIETKSFLRGELYSEVNISLVCAFPQWWLSKSKRWDRLMIHTQTNPGWRSSSWYWWL